MREIILPGNRPLSTDAETKDFAHLTSYPVRGWTGKNNAFCSPGTQNGRCVIKVYERHDYEKRYENRRRRGEGWVKNVTLP